MPMKLKNAAFSIFALTILVGLFGLASTTRAHQPIVPVRVAKIAAPPNCQLASLVAVIPGPFAEVSPSSQHASIQTTAICESNKLMSSMPLEEFASKMAEKTSVCGGEPGQSVASTLVVNGQLANISRIGATFDQNGCADLSAAYDQANQPLAPTSLQLVEISTSSRFGWLNVTGLIGLFFLFLLITGSWMVMFRSHRSPPLS